jgi:hypothetical protein
MPWLHPINIQAQWRSVGHFNSAVNAIYVIDDPRVILVGTRQHGVYRSSDEGKSWVKLLFDDTYEVNDFDFKDQHTGWASCVGGAQSGCSKTTDAGVSWVQVYPLKSNSIHYEPSNGRLFVSNGGIDKPSVYSEDEGTTWKDLPFNGRTGFAFTSKDHGIAARWNLASDGTYITEDGGNTWKETALYGESWQPFAVRGTRTLLANYEPGGEIYRSDDGGYVWTVAIDLYPIGATGDMHSDSCGSLYMQTTTKGLIRSSNYFSSVEYIEGPSNIDDSRFHLEGKNLFAGDFSDTLKGGANLWQYVGSPLELRIPRAINVAVCHDTSFAIKYEFPDFCIGAYPELIQADLSGSEAFIVDGDFSPRKIRTAQEIAVRFVPRRDEIDTTVLTLTFWTGNLTFDTTITFIGHGPSPQDVSLNLVTDKTLIENNEHVNVKVVPDNVVQSAGLNTMSFNVVYRDDLFRLIEATSPVGALIGNGQHIGSRMVIPVALNGKDVSLDPNQPIVQLRLASRLSDSVRTEISLSDLMLNDGDIEYQNCKLSASSTSTSVEVALNCGDPTIQSVIRGERALAIKSITPNPTNGKLTIDYESKLSGEVMLSVYSVNGVVIHEEVIHSAGKPIQLDTSGWPSGAYTIVLRSGDDEARGSAIKK